MMENLFDSLCSCLMLSSNRDRFLKGEGLQLMNLMLRYLISIVISFLLSMCQHMFWLDICGFILKLLCQDICLSSLFFSQQVGKLDFLRHGVSTFCLYFLRTEIATVAAGRWQIFCLGVCPRECCRSGKPSEDLNDLYEGRGGPLDISRENSFPFVPLFQLHCVLQPLS